MNFDGTEIDIIKIEEGVYEKNKYWRINDKEIFIKRSALNLLPCLIDELKPIFNIEKTGTRWTKFKGKFVILLKPEIENDEIIEELTLDQIDYEKELEEEVQKIFLFRELLGTSKNFESSIILRNTKYKIKPVSFYEPSMNPTAQGKVIPDTILNKWFIGKNLDDMVKEFFKIEKLEDLNYVLSEFRSKLLKVFNMYPHYINYLDEIISRIRSKLQFIL